MSTFIATEPAAEKNKERGTDYSQCAQTYLLPVNVSVKPGICLSIETPKDFFTLPEMLERFINKSESILEFIPRGETFENWSKIFTIQTLIGNRLSADRVADFLTQSLASGAKQSSVVEICKKNGPASSTYRSVSVAIQYISREDKVEFIFFNYFSGPYDCSGFQYTEKLDSWLEPKEAKEKASEMRAKFEKTAKIFSMPDFSK
jgi:hypothetical protein